MIRMLGDNVRIRSEGNPMEVASDIFVEVLKGDQWVVEHSYNSMSDDYAITNAKKLAESIMFKLR
jgi:hypothetical protein